MHGVRNTQGLHRNLETVDPEIKPSCELSDMADSVKSSRRRIRMLFRRDSVASAGRYYSCTPDCTDHLGKRVVGGSLSSLPGLPTREH